MQRPHQIYRFSVGLAAVLTAGTLAGCRSVTVVSFMPVYGEVDSVIVDTDQTKSPIKLGGLDETVGFYDLTGSTIHITTSACMGDTLVYASDKNWNLPADHIVITMRPPPDGQTSCPKIEGNKVTYDAGPGGLGGAAGSGEVGGATGSGGSNGSGGGAGEGGRDAGAGSAAGTSGAGGCDDAGAGGNAGHAAVDAGFCDPPPGPAVPPLVGIPSTDCADYCNRIIGSRDGGGSLCPDSYSDVSECLGYCSLVNWPRGTPTDMGDSMACRLYYLQMAEGEAIAEQTFCDNAGPSGGVAAAVGKTTPCGYSTGGACPTFCNAWGRICGVDPASCLSACAASTPPQPTCRFKWLRRAVSDRNYCSLVDFSAPCRLPDC
jgi:hypothetical protein